MFRKMRRHKQALCKEECEAILLRGTSGVLALSGDGGYPYAVPLSYNYSDGAIFFHCAKSGHKLDAIKRCEKASFCVIDQDKIVPEEFTTYFRSVIAFGHISIIDDSDDIHDAIKKFAVKYSAAMPLDAVELEIDKNFSNLCMLRLDIDHLSGKVCRELMNEKS